LWSSHWGCSFGLSIFAVHERLAFTMAADSRKEFLEERRQYIDAEVTNARRHREIVIAGAAGTLALSITFLEEIAPTPVPWTLWFLGVGWVAMLVSLALSVLSFRVTVHAHQSNRRRLDKLYLGEGAEEEQKEVDSWNQKTVSAGSWADALLALGMGCLAVFAFLNVAL
jgi:hypothetical protein